MVAYSFDSLPSYSMKSIARNGKALMERTNPICACDYKDPDIVAVPVVSRAGGFCPKQSAKTRGIGWEEEVSPTLRAGVTPAVVTGFEPAVCYAQQAISDYKQPDVASNLTETPELYQTLQAKSNGGQSLNYSGAIRVRYIVRRLTPTECARLQGFTDRWGDIDEKSDFTEEEYRFWLNVRNTHAIINGKQVKDYTKPQMVKWYNGLHTDSAEYKLWGNGIALPPALYCMQGMTKALRSDWLDELLKGDVDS
jgi:DNA (cytosine-5)-methyltransferase 1